MLRAALLPVYNKVLFLLLTYTEGLLACFMTKMQNKYLCSRNTGHNKLLTMFTHVIGSRQNVIVVLRKSNIFFPALILMKYHFAF